jgi:hypothetical protein
MGDVAPPDLPRFEPGQGDASAFRLIRHRDGVHGVFLHPPGYKPGVAVRNLAEEKKKGSMQSGPL